MVISVQITNVAESAEVTKYVTSRMTQTVAIAEVIMVSAFIASTVAKRADVKSTFTAAAIPLFS